MEIYELKETLLKEQPTQILTVEHFATLDLVENYLLNKMAGRESLNFGKNEAFN